MSEPEIKMKNFDQIIKTVSTLRGLQLERRDLDKRTDSIRENLTELGITCFNTTNCSAVGKLCYKCRNNNSRRNYFRDLMAKGEDTGIYAMSASMFDSAE
jgi:hypothetical protein